MDRAVAKQNHNAITERGTRTRYPESVVDLALRLHAMAGGRSSIAAEQLQSEGINLARQTIENWVNHSFPQRYWQIRKDLGPEIAEDVAGRALERARRADEAQALYIEKAIEKINEVPAEHLPKSVQSFSTAKSQDIQMSQLLRDKPTEIKRIDIRGTIASLEKLGVLEKQDEAIDVEVIEDE